MCGITGFIDLSARTPLDDMKRILRNMADAVVHRGPDDYGEWYDPTSGIALGHRRLSIIDLSANGSQPMQSTDDRYCIIFNGEIYNFQELREQLIHLGHTFRGNSDTEVILKGVCQWGLSSTLCHLVGMFAFALWDKQNRVLHLVRDRIGEKPLYYGWEGQTLFFGSELKSLRANPKFRGVISKDALALYLRHNYIPGPYSIYENVFKLKPGTFLSIPLNKHFSELRPVTYWSLDEAVENGHTNKFTGNDEEAVSELERLLSRSVREQMLATDVPIGALLSGGIDSSTVVALMQSQSSIPAKTFSIGFHEHNYNEAIYAKQVASYLGTDHTELYVTAQEAMEVIPLLPNLYDEPFSDSSQIPTFLVSKLARQNVTVSLSGDGGDELFGGYNRYTWANSIWNKLGWLPRGIRHAAGHALMSISPDMWNSISRNSAPILPSRFRQLNSGDKVHKIAELLEASNRDDMYMQLISHWKNPSKVAIGSEEPKTQITSGSSTRLISNFIERMMYLDTLMYLPDDILVKVDRAGMGVSLETRVPFLDYRVVEFAWKLPLKMKIRNGQGKWILRQLLYNHVPRHLVERPKMGFGVPIGDWLRTSLREWGEGLLNEHRLKCEGFFNSQEVSTKWHEHVSGQRNNQYYLWDILMFQSWLEQING